MHPGSKDYTQGVIAWSIHLDGSGRGLVEEFLSALRPSQFEREDDLVEPGCSANELVKTSGSANDEANDQQPRPRSEPAIKEPADDQPTDYGCKQ